MAAPVHPIIVSGELGNKPHITRIENMDTEIKNVDAEKVDLLCPDCGYTFSVFLRDMAEHNAKIVCPKCGRAPIAAGQRAGSAPDLK